MSHIKNFVTSSKEFSHKNNKRKPGQEPLYAMQDLAAALPSVIVDRAEAQRSSWLGELQDEIVQLVGLMRGRADFQHLLL